MREINELLNRFKNEVTMKVHKYVFSIDHVYVKSSHLTFSIKFLDDNKLLLEYYHFRPDLVDRVKSIEEFQPKNLFCCLEKISSDIRKNIYEFYNS
jgi:hypothetical protein